ncbi:hypothetical protein K6106_11440 [Pseudomonas fluorescens]|nr:hypothetical protein K6106_11440 [Pseudomonas fluorescens]
MPGEYSLPDLLERMYENQLALEAALMEFALQSERQGLSEVGDNAGHIKQGLAKFKSSNSG